MIPAAGWLALFFVYLRCAAGTFTFEDSPELLASAATLGNAHEPGYPLLCLLNRLALLLPVGTWAFRQNLLGAAAAAGAAVLAGSLASAVLQAQGAGRGLSVIGGAFTAAVWGLSDAFWWQAGIGDKYPLLYLLFVTVLWLSWHGRVSIAALGFGLAIAHHPFGLFAAPAFGRVAWTHRRRAPLLLLLVCLPLSMRIMYPPVRAVSDMNWGNPVTAYRLERYLVSGRYHESMAEARAAPGGGMESGAALGLRLVNEEMSAPRLLPAAMAVGAFVLFRLSPGFAWALGGCILCNAALAIQTPEKVVRWYGPVLAILAILAGIGWMELNRLFGRWGALTAVFGVAAVAGLEAARGLDRNDLSSFYAAHDTARNLLISLPRGAVYLGRGDDDLFPLWAGRFGEGMRPDVEAVGMGTLVDIRPADAGGVRRLSARVGFAVKGWDHLRWLLTSPRGIPVRYARTGYDDVLWTSLRLQSQRSTGLTAEWRAAFDPAGSLAATRRIRRGFRWRSFGPRAGSAVFDPDRPRDEVARDALLQPVHAWATLGLQMELAAQPAAAREMFARAAEWLEPFVASPPDAGPPADSRAVVVRGFTRLAEFWDRRGVPTVAARFRSSADRLGSPAGR